MTIRKKSNFLKEISWDQFVERKKQTDLAIIPSGAFEVYGRHLPLGSDTLVSVKISEMVAARVNAIIGPTLEVGDSATLMSFPGTIAIKPEHFKQYLMDVVSSLRHWGFTKFLFMNSHYGNVHIINSIAREMQAQEGVQCAQIDFWRFIQSHCDGIIESKQLAHAHASEAGTSVMMYLYPELCDMDKAVHEKPQMTDAFPEIIKYIPYSKRSSSGSLGDSTLGTAEKGEALVQRSVDRIVQFLVQSWGLKEE